MRREASFDHRYHTGPGWSRELAVMTGELPSEIMDAIRHQVFRFNLADADKRLHIYLENETYHVFVAVDTSLQSQVVGFAAAYESHASYAGGTFGTIAELYVGPECRHRGVGRNLITILRTYGLQRGWQRLKLATPHLPEFQTTPDFYEKRALQ